MPTKDERLEMRVSRTDRALIEDAASRLDEKVSDFARSAAVMRAQQVLARTETTLMPLEQFEGLLHSLDQADEAPRLAKAFAQPRRFKRA
jgi:uncharacterized protein (DUF1778 family)